MICKNCGAQFDDNLAKCPYCNTFHYAGARKEYMGKLEDMKEDLNDLHQVVPDLYQEQFRSHTKQARKTIFRIFVVLVTLVVLLLVSHLILNRAGSRDEKKTLLFMKEAYPIADQYYNDGDYDGLLDFYHTSITENESADFYNWDHYSFLICYENKMIFQEAANNFQSREFSAFDIHELFYCYLSNHYYLKNYSMDETDHQLISSFEKEMESVIGSIRLTNEEAEELNNLLISQQYPSWEDIHDFSKKIYQRIR